MPGSLQLAQPTAVLPAALSRSFVLTTAYPYLSNSYQDGSVEIGLITDGVNPARPMRSWQISRRLTTAALVTLKTFWEVTVLGGLRPFYFYDPYEVAPGQQIGSNYDATGFSTQGRMIVVFKGNWQHAVTLGRCDVPSLLMKEVT